MSEKMEIEDIKSEVNEIYREKLGKKLAYLLRYGAEKEGLTVHPGGYVDLMELIKVPLLEQYTPYQVLQEVDNSLSFRKTRRYQRKMENNTILVRAIYGRRMERNPLHEDSSVPRLVEKCLDLICKNLHDYDLTTFPDEYLVTTVMNRLRFERRLNNRSLQCLLGEGLERLHLDRMYVTEGTIKLVTERCPHLKQLSLRDCGYIMTDHFMERLLKKLTKLESLNLSSCKHLTDRTLKAISKHLPNLTYFNGTSIPSFTEQGILNMVFACEKLKHIDIYSNRNISDEGRNKLVQVAKTRGMTILLNGLQEEGITLDNPSETFGKLWW